MKTGLESGISEPRSPWQMAGSWKRPRRVFRSRFQRDYGPADPADTALLELELLRTETINFCSLKPPRV